MRACIRNCKKIIAADSGHDVNFNAGLTSFQQAQQQMKQTAEAEKRKQAQLQPQASGFSSQLADTIQAGASSESGRKTDNEDTTSSKKAKIDTSPGKDHQRLVNPSRESRNEAPTYDSPSSSGLGSESESNGDASGSASESGFNRRELIVRDWLLSTYWPNP